MTPPRCSRSTLARAVAASALVLLAGCHPRGGSAHGGLPWREYRTRHFRLATDLEPGPARAGLARLERIRALVVASVPHATGEIPGYVRVVVPARETTYAALNEIQIAGYFTVGLLGEPTIVLRPTAWKHDPEVVAHELTHQVISRVYPRPPRWFGEGLAQFVETVARDGAAPAAGRVPRTRVADLARAPRIAVGDLLAWRLRDPSKDEAVFELWSWILYRWLQSERGPQLTEYQRRLAAFEDPERAWSAAFPDLDASDPQALARLEDGLDAYRRKGDFPALPVRDRVAAAPGEGGASDRPLSSADVHVLLDDVTRRGPGDSSAGRAGPAPVDPRAEIAEALREDPMHPVALARRASMEDRSAAEELRAATSARPGDWRGWLLLGVALPRDDLAGREAAFRRAVALEPESGLAWTALASVLVGGERWEEALPAAKHAVALLPWAADAPAMYALAAARAGACDEAIRFEQLAQRWLEAAGWTDRQWAASIRDRCGSPRSP